MVQCCPSVSCLLQVLLGCTHCGFPVIKSLGEKLENTFCGEITRLELRNLMTRPELFIRKTDFNTTVRMPHMSDIMHPHFRQDCSCKLRCCQKGVSGFVNHFLACLYSKIAAG